MEQVGQRRNVGRDRLFAFLYSRDCHDNKHPPCTVVVLFTSHGALWMDHGGYFGKFEWIGCNGTFDERRHDCGRRPRIRTSRHRPGTGPGPLVSGVCFDLGLGAGRLCRWNDEAFERCNISTEPKPILKKWRQSSTPLMLGWIGIVRGSFDRAIPRLATNDCPRECVCMYVCNH